MPAYFESGFSVREPMWHGLGLVADEYPESWDDARRMAGMLWEPTERPVYARTTVTLGVGESVPEGVVTLGELDHDLDADTVTLDVMSPAGFKGIARDDTGEILHVASDEYSVITHAQMGELLDAVLDTDTGVKFETAGVLRGGRSVWALAYLDEPWQAPGDESATYPYLAFLNSHDGTGACKVLPTNVRVVCWNTFNAASAAGDRNGHQVVIRHSGNVADRIEEAKLTLANVRADAIEWQGIATDLAGINVSDAMVAMFLDRFIPLPGAEETTERVVSDRAARRALFMATYNESPTMDGIRGNAYGLVQCAGEYLDHLRPYRSEGTYLSRTMLRPEPIKAGVLTVVRDLVSAN